MVMTHAPSDPRGIRAITRNVSITSRTSGVASTSRPRRASPSK